MAIDSRSVKSASIVGKDSHGHDPGKKINGRERHLVIDTRDALRDMVGPARLRDAQPTQGRLITRSKRHPNLTIKSVTCWS
ncbi:hypothetical protein HFP71_33100 [Streptomyces sp. ARC32]